MHEYLCRITAPLDDYKEIQKNLVKFKCTLTRAVFEKGKHNENPHFHLTFTNKYKDSYLRKNLFSKTYKSKYSLKYFDSDQTVQTERYFSKLEHNGDKVLLANWDVKLRNKEYWEVNDKMTSGSMSITDKLLHHYKNKFKPLTDDRIKQIQNSLNTIEIIDPIHIQIWYSNIEYFRTNKKLIPLNYDMTKYIKTIRLHLEDNDDYLDFLCQDFFKQF